MVAVTNLEANRIPPDRETARAKQTNAAGRNAAGDETAQPGRKERSRTVNPARIVLIESRMWLRDCLAYALESFLPGVAIEGVNSIDDIVPGPGRLFLMGLDPRSGCQPAELSETIKTLRRVGEGSPIGAYLHSDNPSVAALLATLGVAGIVMPSASVAIAVASIRLMAAGGSFMPPQFVERRVDGPVEADALDCVAPAPEPRAIAPPAESPSSLDNLTARERDVLESLSAGRANKIIAFDLHISENTVKAHLRSIMKKLHAANRTQVAMRVGELTAEVRKSGAPDNRSRRDPNRRPPTRSR
jgi:two-component system, NarL family, nitrate/nitrite response regulator NarL